MSETNRRFGPIRPEDLSPEQRAVADSILHGPRGGSKLQGPFEAMLQSPGFAAHAEKIGAHIRFSTSLPRPLNEMVILMVARRYNAQFEWWAHKRFALEAGLDPDIIDAIEHRSTPVLDPDGQAIYQFASELLDNAEVNDDTFDAVTTRWSKRGAMDLIAAVGYYTIVSYVLNVDRYPVPGGDTALR